MSILDVSLTFFTLFNPGRPPPRPRPRFSPPPRQAPPPSRDIPPDESPVTIGWRSVGVAHVGSTLCQHTAEHSTQSTVQIVCNDA